MFNKIFNYYYKIIRLQTNYLGLNLTLGILLIITGIATLFKSVLFYLKKVITKLSDNVKIIKRKSDIININLKFSKYNINFRDSLFLLH